jgi:peptidyl-prolyl cis-trans isomerase C
MGGTITVDSEYGVGSTFTVTIPQKVVDKTPINNLDTALQNSEANKNITSADVDAMIATMGPQGQNYQSAQGRAAVLEQIIGRQLILMDAKRNLMDREPAFMAELEKVKEDLLAGYALQKVMARVKVTEEDCKKFYAENKEMFNTGDTVSASHILVDSAEQAEALMAAIQAGEIAFEAAAQEYSSCPSGQQGGSLGEFGRGQMVPEFDEACFTMEVGELRGPVQTQFGFHIIRLNARNEAKIMEYSEVKENIEQHLMNQKQTDAYRSKVNQLKILFPVDRF